jgi:hypothetical protein
MFDRKNQSASRVIVTVRSDYLRLPNREGRVIHPMETADAYANLPTSFPMEEDALPLKKMYPFMDRQVPGQEVEFEPKSEPWSQYTLADGTEVKMKMILLNAARLDEFTAQGDPVYQFQFQQVLTIIAPDALKRKPQ